MTEAEWLAYTDPTPMLLGVLSGRGTGRKLRLLGCAYCRSIWGRLAHPSSRKAVEVAEAFADGQASLVELETAARNAERAARWPGRRRPLDVTATASWVAQANLGAEHVSAIAGECRNTGEEIDYTTLTLTSLADPAKRKAWKDRSEETRRLGLWQADLVRDVFGNPFRPVTPDPSWLTPAVTAQAVAIYAERAFDRLPILADALEDAGCDNADLLAHCRGDGPHVRGCWVVDLVLGKE
jgi:hypothetical protein